MAAEFQYDVFLNHRSQNTLVVRGSGALSEKAGLCLCLDEGRRIIPLRINGFGAKKFN